MYDHLRAISYINNKRGLKTEFCQEIATILWVWCTSKNMWVSAVHISGTSNTRGR